MFYFLNKFVCFFFFSFFIFVIELPREESQSDGEKYQLDRFYTDRNDRFAGGRAARASRTYARPPAIELCRGGSPEGNSGPETPIAERLRQIPSSEFTSS